MIKFKESITQIEEKLKSVTNQYGNFSFNNDCLPPGLVCLTHESLTDGRKRRVFDKNCKIPYVIAVHGWKGRNTNRYRCYMKPDIVGIIVHVTHVKTVFEILGNNVNEYIHYKNKHKY